jgi:hypothetical protein
MFSWKSFQRRQNFSDDPIFEGTTNSANKCISTETIINRFLAYTKLKTFGCIFIL